jgi:hypothetical protein
MDVDTFDSLTEIYNEFSTWNIQSRGVYQGQPSQLGRDTEINPIEANIISSQIYSIDYPTSEEPTRGEIQDSIMLENTEPCMYTYKTVLFEFMKNVIIIVALFLSIIMIYDRLVYLINTLLLIVGILSSAYIMILFNISCCKEDNINYNPILAPVEELDEKCSICWEGVNLYRTVCGHIFHEDCLWDWINSRKGTQLCPYCKAVNIFESDLQ